MCEGYAKTQLLSGVTTIRTVGGIADIDTRLRGRIAAGKCDGPRILAADMAVSVPGGHMAGSLAYEATSAAQAAEDVRKIAQGKPDLIKLMITGGVLDAKKKGEPGELKMPPEYVRAACGEAHRLGLPRCGACRKYRGRARGARKRRGYDRARREAGRGNSAPFPASAARHR